MTTPLPPAPAGFSALAFGLAREFYPGRDLARGGATTFQLDEAAARLAQRHP